MRNFLSLVMVMGLVACSAGPAPLTVKQFQVRDQVRNAGEEPMVRMEKERHLLGAVSMEQRRQRLGQYYTMPWHDPAGVNCGQVEVVFQYQQGATGSRVKRMVKSYGSSTAEGVAEFAVIGDDYFKGGRVLAWKATLSRGGREIASKQSYLWR